VIPATPEQRLAIWLRTEQPNYYDPLRARPDPCKCASVEFIRVPIVSKDVSQRADQFRTEVFCLKCKGYLGPLV
jgi:hypothetical protein